MNESEKLLVFALGVVFHVVALARGNGASSETSLNNAAEFVGTAKSRGVLPKLPPD